MWEFNSAIYNAVFGHHPTPFRCEKRTAEDEYCTTQTLTLLRFSCVLSPLTTLTLTLGTSTGIAAKCLLLTTEVGSLLETATELWPRDGTVIHQMEGVLLETSGPSHQCTAIQNEPTKKYWLACPKMSWFKLKL